LFFIKYVLPLHRCSVKMKFNKIPCRTHCHSTYRATGQPLCIGKGVFIMEEIWKDIPGYEGKYQASSIGRIKSLSREVFSPVAQKRLLPEIIMKQHFSRWGYFRVGLPCNITPSKRVEKDVHRLILLTFKGMPENPNKKHCNHIDGNKLNNAICNLEWVTCGENQKHAYDLGLKKRYFGDKSWKIKLSDSCFKMLIEELETSTNLTEVAHKYGVDPSYCSKLKSKKMKRYINMMEQLAKAELEAEQEVSND